MFTVHAYSSVKVEGLGTRDVRWSEVYCEGGKAW